MGGSGDADVLVIGAGPAGLFAALELVRHGVRSRVVERQPRPHQQARATALQPGTLEILQQAGCLDRLLGDSVHLRFARAFKDGVLAGLEEADDTRRQMEAAWVIGAGGAHGPTRASMGEQLAGSTYPGAALAADLRVTCGLPRDGSALIGCAAGYVFLAPLPGGRWISFIGDLDRQEAAELGPDPGPGPVTAAIGRRIPPGLVIGFRAAPAGREGLLALDAQLDSYLVPAAD